MIVKTKCQFTKNRNYKSEMKKRNMKNDKPAYYYYKHNCSSFLGSSSLILYTKIVHNETEAIMKSHYAKKKRYFQNFKSFSKSFELFKYDFITALPPLCIVGY